MLWFSWAQFWNHWTKCRMMTLRNQLDNFFWLNTSRKDPCTVILGNLKGVGWFSPPMHSSNIQEPHPIRFIVIASWYNSWMIFIIGVYCVKQNISYLPWQIGLIEKFIDSMVTPTMEFGRLLKRLIRLRNNLKVNNKMNPLWISNTSEWKKFNECNFRLKTKTEFRRISKVIFKFVSL